MGDCGAADQDAENEEPQRCRYACPERVWPVGSSGRCGWRGWSWRVSCWDGVGERCARSRTKLGIDKSKLGADRLQRHAYEFSLRAGIPRGSNLLDRPSRVRAWVSTASLNHADSRARVCFGRLAPCACTGYDVGDIDEGRMRVRTHDRNRARCACRGCEFGDTRRRRVGAFERRRHHRVPEAGPRLPQGRPRRLGMPLERARRDLERAGSSRSAGPSRAGRTGWRTRSHGPGGSSRSDGPSRTSRSHRACRSSRSSRSDWTSRPSRPARCPGPSRTSRSRRIRSGVARSAEWLCVQSVRRLGRHGRHRNDLGERRRASLQRQRRATATLVEARDQRDRLRPGRC